MPNWSRSRTGGAKMINARSKTVATKPALKAAVARRRYLAPAMGYFEWMREGGQKIPYFLHASNNAMLAMAGPYEIWRDDSLPENNPKRWLWTCTIITRPASDALGHVHDRTRSSSPGSCRKPGSNAPLRTPATPERPLADMPEPHLELRPRIESRRQREEQRPRPHQRDQPAPEPEQECLDF